MTNELTVQIAIISDTHMPRRGRRLPESCIERLRAADLIVHAGDLVGMSVLRELRGYGEVVAVHGNVDDPDVRSMLPASAVVSAGWARIAVIHDAGPAAGRLERLRARFAGADAVVFGHSHAPLHERTADGFQIFNPGSPTDRRRAPAHTIGIADVLADELRFELVPLR
ncbi:MAG: metallophosphoesterase family protein [Solirubrobacteraceae bacterium]